MNERNSAFFPAISLVAASLAAAALFGCALDSRTPGELERAAETAETAEAAARAAAPGLGGGDSAASGSEQSNASGTGGSSGGSASNGGGSAANGNGAMAGSADCAGAPLLPQNIEEDLTIGPGCVRMNRSNVFSVATLTIRPGTTVAMEANGYLNVLSDPGTNLVAVGTAEQPILFTSASADPVPGDWQCVRIGADATASRLEHVTFEYGGQPCYVDGAGNDTTLYLEAPLRNMENVTVRDSQNYGIMIFDSAGFRSFTGNHFARNGKASIRTVANRVANLGAGNVFEDADDYIEIVNGSGISTSGTWLNQGVPIRVQDMGVVNGTDVTIAAGVRFEMYGTIDAFDANFNIEGTAEQPVVFTSAQKDPAPGDWGCLLYSYSTVTPRIDHAIFEYAGSGRGCLGSSTKAALMAPNSSNITNTIFRYIDGVGISTRGECNVSDWCQNQFVDVAMGPFLCESTYTPCP